MYPLTPSSAGRAGSEGGTEKTVDPVVLAPSWSQLCVCSSSSASPANEEGSASELTSTAASFPVSVTLTFAARLLLSPIASM